MEWSKLKNIILLILAAANLFLLVIVVRQEVQGADLQHQARLNAISFLEEKGIQVPEDLVPQTMTLRPQTVERDLEAECAQAASLLKGSVRMEALGSEVYRYQNDNGFLQFHSDGSFSAEFAPGVFPLGSDRTQSCLEVLDRMEFQGKLLREEGDQLTFRQMWEGVSLFNQQVTLVCRENCVAAMTSGKRLVGRPVEDSGQTPITVATALIRFCNGLSALGDVCSRIDAIERGYVSTASLSGTMTLTPVWQITTNTGAYQMDTMNGELIRLS